MTMSFADPQLLRQLYPDWYTTPHYEIYVEIFLLIALFLLLPYVFRRFLEKHINNMKNMTDITEIKNN